MPVQTSQTLAENQPRNTHGFTEPTLRHEKQRFIGTGGVSRANRDQDFVAAFRDVVSGRVYRSGFADGRPAPVHILDVLPNDVIMRRYSSGRITAVKPTVVAGFEYAGRFYTRWEVAAMISMRGAAFA